MRASAQSVTASTAEDANASQGLSPALTVACAATTVLCLVYVASYRKSASRRPPTPLAGA